MYRAGVCRPVCTGWWSVHIDVSVDTYVAGGGLAVHIYVSEDPYVPGGGLYIIMYVADGGLAVHNYVSVDPYVPGGGLYSLGKVVSWRLLNAYLGAPVFFSQLNRLTPSLEYNKY